MDIWKYFDFHSKIHAFVKVRLIKILYKNIKVPLKYLNPFTSGLSIVQLDQMLKKL